MITAGLWKHTVWRIHKFQLLYVECNYVEYKAPGEAVFPKYTLSVMQWSLLLFSPHKFENIINYVNGWSFVRFRF